MNHYIKIIILLVISHINMSLADNICDIALSHKAFDIKNSVVTSNIASAMRNELCSKNYESLNSARQKARNMGFGVVIDSLPINFSGSSNGSSSSGSIKESLFCSASQVDFDKAYKNENYEQVSRFALDAWKTCIQETNTNGIFINYEVQENGLMFNGDIFYKVISGRTDLVPTVTGIATSGPAKSIVSCVIGGQERITGDQLFNFRYQLTSTKTQVSCEKNIDDELSKQTASVAIQTSIDSLPAITLPSLQSIDNDRITHLEQTISALKTSTNNNSVPIGTIIASLVPYKNFIEVNNFKRGSWVPCDGRRLNNDTIYFKNVNTHAPDLRGLFIRGVNKMGTAEDGVKKANQDFLNPDNLDAGSIQRDSFKSHDHKFWRGGYGGGDQRYFASNPRDMLSGQSGPTFEHKTTIVGNKETRPKNMSVWYYIKVN